MESVSSPEVVTMQPVAGATAPHQSLGYNPAPIPQGHTTVVVQQQQTVMRGERGWNTGLFDCFSDIGTCFCGLFCSSYLMMTVSGKLGESSMVPCCVPGGTIALRVKLRTKHRIEGSILKDCCAAYWCHPCMICQMDRELATIEKNTPTRM